MKNYIDAEQKYVGSVNLYVKDMGDDESPMLVLFHDYECTKMVTSKELLDLFKKSPLIATSGADMGDEYYFGVKITSVFTEGSSGGTNKLLGVGTNNLQENAFIMFYTSEHFIQ